MERVWGRLMHACGAMAAVALGVVAVLVTFDVVSRNIGLGSFPWIMDVSEYSLPFATFLAAPWLLHKNEHVRLDILLIVVPRAVAQWLERISDLAGIAISVTLVVYGLRVMRDSIRLDSVVYKALVIPEWWTFVPVPVCFALLTVEFARRLRRGYRPEHSGPATLATQEELP